MQDQETIIISLGGSIIVPDVPNAEFIKEFKNIILRWIENGKKFVIIVGGGKTCRRYQETLGQVINATTDELDWMGIYSTRLNAELVRLAFGEVAYEEIITNPTAIKSIERNLIIGAGWKPGFSTDTGAVLMAKELNTKKIINLSNIDYVYDSDPKINSEAKKFQSLSWKEYRSYISSVWTPGMNTPFDPIASEKAEKDGVELAFMSGHDLKSLEDYLKGESFIGTTIK